MKKGTRRMSMLLVATLIAGCFSGCGNSAAEVSTEDAKTYSYTEGTKLVWEDNFDAKKLNRKDWNVELHEPGWVNEEWQEYVDSEENIKLEDGYLYINPIKSEDSEGNATYTSGRISTQHKQDFTYGVFECRAKVPSGKGYLPAFWLMSSDENIYGQWPRCGEIDIMEILGDNTKNLHGTIHYGNPHEQRQGEYMLSTIESFASDFHTFACEWEPGKITWYVDGVKYYEANDWYSTTEGQGTLTYPAPFDQPFYIILNLAVGGSWVGYPDETTSFDNNPFVIDYVRVYQKDEYDENVKAPEHEVIEVREPNADGNYVNNGDFAVEENLTDAEDWKFLLADGGKGSATIADNTMIIASEDDGNVDYSVQLVQPRIPMEMGATYEISFDAYASEDRTTHLAVKAPDRGWVEYFKTTTVELTTEKQTYTYEFKMTNDTDPNGRLEFNNGAQDSTGTIYLSNVSVRKLSAGVAIDPDQKTILADGNHVYNGKFQEGDSHLGDWTIDNNANATIEVTNFADGRRLHITGADKALAEDVVLSQNKLAIIGGKQYFLTFDAESKKKGEITFVVGGQEYTEQIKKGNNSYKIVIPADADFATTDFAVKAGGFKDLYLDNITLAEAAMIINGSFNAGFAGYEWYADSSADASYVVDSLSEDNALDVTVNKTGDADWKVQVKQNNITLEKGKKYKLSFKAKSSADRKIRVLLQGLENRDWAAYSGDGFINLTSEYQEFEIEFTMEEKTDEAAFLSICLGAVDGVEINEQHRIVIDDIVLE